MMADVTGNDNDFNVLLVDAEILADNLDQGVAVLSALPFNLLAGEQVTHEFTLPWLCPNSAKGARITTQTYPDRLHHTEGAEAEFQRLRQLINGSHLIGFDLPSLCKTFLNPIFAAYHVEPPQLKGISLRDLAQRLLDPNPEACRSLRSLCVFCDQPMPVENHRTSAVMSMAAILSDALWPKLEGRSLTDWDQIVAFASSPWFPSRIAFGKYKGRHFQEARGDQELKAWLEGLCQSNNGQSAVMARWYLEQLHPSSSQAPGLIAYIDPEIEEIQSRIAVAREQLAELDAEYTEEHKAVAGVESQLFLLLRACYEKRDQLQLRIQYRRRFLDALIREGEEQAAKVAEEHQQAKEESQRAYEDASREASETDTLSSEEQQELRSIYRRLATLFHPDRYAQDPAKQSIYETLMKMINSAKDMGWIERLREIARDPNGFLQSQGFSAIDLGEDTELDKLQLLYEKLIERVEQVKAALDQLRKSSGYEIWQLSLKDTSFIEKVAADQINDLNNEIAKLEAEADSLATEIEMLTGKPDPVDSPTEQNDLL